MVELKSYNEWINENVEIGAVNLSLNAVYRSISQISNPRLKAEVLEAFQQFQNQLGTLMEKYANEE